MSAADAGGPSAAGLAGGATALVSLGYLSFYTAHCQKTQSLSLKLLLDVLFVRRSLAFTTTELDQLVALTGSTLVGLAFWPAFDHLSAELIRHAHVLAWVHTVYLVCYCVVTRRILSVGGVRGLLEIKMAALILGAGAHFALWAAHTGRSEPLVGGVFALVAGVAHQYTLAVDKRGTARIRPMGYVPIFVMWIGLSWSMTLARLVTRPYLEAPREHQRDSETRLRDGPIRPSTKF